MRSGTAAPSRTTTSRRTPDAPRRSVRQMQADALVQLCEHALGCSQTDLPLQGATVVVRINHDDLVDNTGYATIDGITAPVSVSTARRMAAGGRVISCVLGGDSPRSWTGAARNGSSPPRNGSRSPNATAGARCAGHHPGHTKVHHIRWWARDAGPTDLANGVLLCESCHHRIHDNRLGHPHRRSRDHARRCGSSPHPTSTPHAHPDSAGQRTIRLRRLKPIAGRSQPQARLSPSGRSEPLDDRRVRHAAALAHRLQAVAAAGGLEVVDAGS